MNNSPEFLERVLDLTAEKLAERIFNKEMGRVSGKTPTRTPAAPTTKTLPSAFNVRESWYEFLETPLSVKDFSKKYGFTRASSLIKRWEAEGVYDIVEHYRMLSRKGVTGYPLNLLLGRMTSEQADRAMVQEPEIPKEVVVTEVDPEKFANRLESE